MKSRLITSSLIGSVDWLKTAPSTPKKGTDTTWKQDAYNQLLDTLNRVWVPPEVGSPIDLGIKFEKQVYANMRKEEQIGSDHFWSVVQQVKGGTVQDKLKKNMVIDGEKYFLYGKTDVLFPKKIIDIKTTAKYKAEKYTGSFQHKLYMYISGINIFEYIIVVWDKAPVISKVKNVIIGFNEQEMQGLEQYIKDKIKGCMDYLQARPVLWQAYNDNYCLY